MLVARHLRPTVAQALAESRVVCVLGARQSGKSTLVRLIAAEEHPAPYLTLDDPAALDVALEDPTGFLAGHERLVIDEVQRAPELLLAIKRRVDENPARGQFLLTGSANLVTHPRIADALPGRADYLTLWPLSQAELHGPPSTFLDQAFSGSVPVLRGAPVGLTEYTDAVVRGGFPEAVTASPARRIRFFAGYVDSILGREVADMTSIREVETVGRILRLVAARTATLSNQSAIARDLGVDHKTVAAHLRVLEQLFLVVRLPAWHVNLGHRVIKTPKLHLADTGMLTALAGADAARLAADPSAAGGPVESFVVTEMLRQASSSSLGPLLQPFHFRDQRGNEVDLVLEHAGGDVVGVEVKAGATPRRSDAAGLALLRDTLGTRFRCGVVLHAGPDTITLGDRLWAVPIRALWDPGATADAVP